MPAENSERLVLLNELAEEFACRYRQGERPGLGEYIQRYPALADDIREFFPALIEMEQVKDVRAGLPAVPPATGPLPPLERLGDYRIVREIGHGGMGVVYEAEQESLGRHVALKVLLKHRLVDARSRQRFEREAKAAAKLHHTNIVPVFGTGEHDGTLYYVMQFIRGTGLDVVITELARMGAGTKGMIVSGGERSTVSRAEASLIAHSIRTGAYPTASAAVGASPPTESNDAVPVATAVAAADSGAVSSSVNLPGQVATTSGNKARRLTYWQSVARVGAQVADALEYAHKQGIIHRDIKPSNLLLDLAGTVWVTDFGLAKADDQQNLTTPGDILGTLRYMPPEAFDGKTDSRSDVYSLGLTLYELAALKPAFNEADRPKLIKQVTEAEPPRLRKVNRQVPRDLETVIHKAIDRDPARRYQTAGQLAADLERFLGDEPVLARRSGTLERGWRWCRRNPGIAVLTGTVAVLLLLLSVGAMTAAAMFFRQAEDQRHLAEEAQRAEHKAAQERQRAIEAQVKAETEAGRATREAERATREAATAAQVTQFLVGLFEPNQRVIVGAGHLGFRSGDKATLRASDLLKRGAERLNRSAALKGQPLVRARLMHEIGWLYFSLGETDAAAPLVEEALRLRRAHLPKDHPDLPGSLRAVGLVRYVQGDETAKDLMEEAIAILKKQPDPESLELAETESALAVCVSQLAEDRALALLEHALAIRRKRLGNDDPETLGNAFVLAWLHMEQKHYLKGLPLIAEVMAGLKNSDADPELAAMVQAAVHALQTQFVQGDRAALPKWRATADHVRKVFGDHHYLTVKAKRLLASMIYDCDRDNVAAVEEVIALYEECLKSGVLPNWEQGLNRLDLSRAQGRLGRTREAEENVQMAITLLRSSGAREVGALPHALQLAATLHAHSNDPKKQAVVEAYLREAVAVSKSSARVPDFRKAHALMDLGRYRLLRGDATTSAPLFAEAAEFRARALGPRNFEVAEALAYQSEALRQQGKIDAADRVRAQAVDILRPHMKQQHPAAQRARSVLAGTMPPWP